MAAPDPAGVAATALAAPLSSVGSPPATFLRRIRIPSPPLPLSLPPLPSPSLPSPPSGFAPSGSAKKRRKKKKKMKKSPKRATGNSDRGTRLRIRIPVRDPLFLLSTFSLYIRKREKENKTNPNSPVALSPFAPTNRENLRNFSLYPNKKTKKMSLPVFKPAQITPIDTQTIPTTKTLSSKPLLPMHRPPPVYGKLCNGLVVRASLPQPSPAVVDGDAMSLLERCFRASPPSDLPSLASSSSLDVMYGPVMKGQYGAFGAATLEKSKLDMSQKQQSKSSPETASGGGNNDSGNSNNLGGGDGGNDDGDDDNYFDNFDDGDEGSEGGLFRRRIVLPELFDQKFVDAVLNEWQRTMIVCLQECNKPMKWVWSAQHKW